MASLDPMIDQPLFFFLLECKDILRNPAQIVNLIFHFGIFQVGIYPWTEEKGPRIMAKTIYSKEHRTLVERLKSARKEAGLDQEEVAKLLGVSQSYVSKIESGQRRIDIVQLKAFARIYRKNIDYFIK